ncbi:MAG: glycoside hydrolase family 13 protein [Limnochordaceae bacterium]|nr:glycoside hydrolase family 13 protein [Limnochordaceae bacterium]
MPVFTFDQQDRAFVNRRSAGRWMFRLQIGVTPGKAVKGAWVALRDPEQPDSPPRLVPMSALPLEPAGQGGSSGVQLWEATAATPATSRWEYQFYVLIGDEPWWVGPEGHATLPAGSGGSQELPQVGWFSQEEEAQPLFPVIPWTQTTVFYQIFPDRFDNGDPSNDPPTVCSWDTPIRHGTSSQYYGGDFAGIRRRLPYLEELGINAIYLNPIFASGSSHGYDTIDFRRVDPRLGTLADFRQLLSEAHHRGIRIILDGVFNHVGRGFWAFQDVCRRGTASPYVDWFFIHSFPVRPDLGNYEGWWGLAELPKLNVAHLPVRRHLLEVVRYWTELGIDGWRLDVPNEVQASGFWEEFRQVVKSVNPLAYIVGEIWRVEREWLQGDKFDGLMNYPWGKDTLLPFFGGDRSWSPERVWDHLRHVLLSYPPQGVAMAFNVVDSHDTERMLTALGGGNLGEKPRAAAVNRMRALVTVQFTLPGVPVIYYGDERGMLGEKLDDWDAQRAPVPWDELDDQIFDWYKKLVWLRRNHPALRGARLELVYANNTNGVLAYRRPVPGHPELDLVVVTGARLEPVHFFLPLPEQPGGYVDLLRCHRYVSGARGVEISWSGPTALVLQAASTAANWIGCRGPGSGV